MADLFVLDTAGDSTPLEDRAVPLLNTSKSSKPSPLTNKPATQPRQEQSHHEDNCSADDDEDDDDDGDYGEFPRATCLIDISHLIPEPAPVERDPRDIALEQFTRLVIACRTRNRSAAHEDEPDSHDDGTATDVAAELKDSINKNIETEHALPKPSEKNKTKLRKLEAAKTKGKKWFDMPATELTEEVQRDLEIIQMRSVLDPKHFYKKNDLKALPKYFQVGKVLPSPLDHYGERGTRSGKKKTIVDELMADAQFQRFNKRKYTETVEEKKRSGYQKAHSKMKKLKKNK